MLRLNIANVYVSCVAFSAQGFHYVIKYDLGDTDTHGTLFIKLKGTYGQSSLIALTG